MTLEEEKKLVEEAQKDVEAFGRLFDEYYPRIFGYVLRRTADVETAKDVVSETFLKALKNLKSFRWQGVYFSSWLYRIAAHETANFFRKKKSVSSLESIVEPASAADLLEEIALAQEKLQEHRDFLAIQKEICSLPQIYQEVLSLRFFEKKQVNEIAEILQKPEGTVKSLLHRGLGKLKDKFNATNR